jgi:hypothetical protein
MSCLREHVHRAILEGVRGLPLDWEGSKAECFKHVEYMVGPYSQENPLGFSLDISTYNKFFWRKWDKQMESGENQFSLACVVLFTVSHTDPIR